MPVWVIPDPDDDDSDEGDRDQDDIEAKEETVRHLPDHLPLLFPAAPLEVFFQLGADGSEVSAQLPQFLQDRVLRLCLRRGTAWELLGALAGDDAGLRGRWSWNWNELELVWILVHIYYITHERILKNVRVNLRL